MSDAWPHSRSTEGRDDATLPLLHDGDLPSAASHDLVRLVVRVAPVLLTLGIFLLTFCTCSIIAFPRWWQLSPPAAVLLLVFFVVTFSLCLTAFVRCALTDPGRLPLGSPSQYVDDGGADSTRTPRGSTATQRTFCARCRVVERPPRAHHCGTCRRCIRKMDHHCIWVGTCVGARNYRFFLLFVFYTLPLCALSLALCAPFAVHDVLRSAARHSASFSVVALVTVSLIAALFGAVLTFFSFVHVRLLGRNVTTLEEAVSSDAATAALYDRGSFLANAATVFGSNIWLAFLPCFFVEPLEL